MFQMSITQLTGLSGRLRSSRAILRSNSEVSLSFVFLSTFLSQFGPQPTKSPKPSVAAGAAEVKSAKSLPVSNAPQAGELPKLP